ncbi:hypothetical protein [uncultured Thiodictyon sp.]|jgi:hypothetical protein|uniref:hypothetical protein n=1 Tax=uncultured Thiodictyon sp. TaxID=1846217 RepID=UPI0025F6A4EE|nr:hypothetical protein [uncultured Thiodictyon sp.]
MFFAAWAAGATMVKANTAAGSEFSMVSILYSICVRSGRAGRRSGVFAFHTGRFDEARRRAASSAIAAMFPPNRSEISS